MNVLTIVPCAGTPTLELHAAELLAPLQLMPMTWEQRNAACEWLTASLTEYLRYSIGDESAEFVLAQLSTAIFYWGAPLQSCPTRVWSGAPGEAADSSRSETESHYTELVSHFLSRDLEDIVTLCGFEGDE